MEYLLAMAVSSLMMITLNIEFKLAIRHYLFNRKSDHEMIFIININSLTLFSKLENINMSFHMKELHFCRQESRETLFHMFSFIFINKSLYFFTRRYKYKFISS
jgi:hypothetical protein